MSAETLLLLVSEGAPASGDPEASLADDPEDSEQAPRSEKALSREREMLVIPRLAAIRSARNLPERCGLVCKANAVLSEDFPLAFFFRSTFEVGDELLHCLPDNL